MRLVAGGETISEPGRVTLAIALLFLVITLAWRWALRAWQLLTSPAKEDPPAEEPRVRRGALGFGGILGAIFAASSAVRENASSPSPIGPVEGLAYNLFVSATIFLPLTLWGGYWWGRAMAGSLRFTKGK